MNLSMAVSSPEQLRSGIHICEIARDKRVRDSYRILPFLLRNYRRTAVRIFKGPLP